MRSGGGLNTLDGFVDVGIDTDFVVTAVSQVFQREVARVYVGDPALSHHDTMEQTLPQGHQARVDAYVGNVPDHGHFKVIGLERKFCLQLLEGSLIDVDASDVVAQQKLSGLAAGLAVFNSLEGKDIEQHIARLQHLAHAFTARAQPVTLVDGLGDHDLALAVHEVHRRRILIGNSNAQVQAGQPGRARALVVGGNDFDDFLRQHAGLSHTKHRLALTLEQRENDGIALNEYLARFILGQQLVDGVVEIQAEI